MPKVTYLAADGASHELDVQTGSTLMLAALGARIEGIAGDCGGVLSCATCHVYVDEPWRSRLPAPADEERAMLDFTAAEREPGSRLCCQIRMTDELDGLVVRLPASQY